MDILYFYSGSANKVPGRGVNEYRTVEHAFQGSKIALANENMAYTFSMDSRSVLDLGDGNAARNARKIIVLTREQLQRWDEIKDKVLEDIPLD